MIEVMNKFNHRRRGDFLSSWVKRWVDNSKLSLVMNEKFEVLFLLIF